MDTHVRRLREKPGERSELLKAVRGVGYRFRLVRFISGRQDEWARPFAWTGGFFVARKFPANAFFRAGME